MNNKAIAHNLKRLRSNARYNQSDLAERAGMSLSGYQKLERGKATPRAASIRALAIALRVPIQEILADIVPSLSSATCPVTFRSASARLAKACRRAWRPRTGSSNDGMRPYAIFVG